jgi:hypothetical protein
MERSMHMYPRRIAASLIVALAAFTLVGCTGAFGGGSDRPGVPLPPSAAPGPAGTAQRTSISTASQQDIAAALRANNVEDPEHWAQVVMQNRPYPTNDPNLGKLRLALMRNHADPADTTKIINALRP